MSPIFPVACFNGNAPLPAKHVKTLALAAILLAAFCAAGTEQADLAKDVASGAMWSMDAQAFQQAYAPNARWVDAEKTTLRIANPAFTLGGLEPGETVVKFQDDRPASLQAMLFNKGDDLSASFTPKTFDAFVAHKKAALSAAFGTPGATWRPVAGDERGAVQFQAWQWKLKDAYARLEHHHSGAVNRGFLAEFVRVRTAREDSKPTATVARRDLKDNVKREGKRAVIDNIPMVDQGEKGYCVVATAARIFAYFGMEQVDQHELASAAGATAGGTSITAMRDALKNIARRFSVTVKNMDAIDSFAELQRLADAYNRAAQRLGEPKITISRNALAWRDFWDKAKPEPLKAARCKNAADAEKWLKPVRQWIDQGVPLCWCVQLGVVSEPVIGNQARGGHMRMIIGYDDEKQTVVYSDSWGKDHASKEMPVADAAAITVDRMALVLTR
ncbi:MAG: hypothetical protein FWF96_06625 [Kiritimatiellaeota bacterium]|nr:hypothetical protein [Kiritimatiellota bacterium]